MEALAIVDSILHLEMYLYRRLFTVEVEDKPLLALLTRNALNKRLRGLWLKLININFTIKYRNGAANSNADGLSRQPWPDIPLNAISSL